MGFELGPGPLRRAPKGWLRARAFPLRHSVYSHAYGADGPPEIEASMGMTVLWRVEIPDRGPYELEEERSVPTWLSTGGLGSSGKRWYRLRVRPAYGLMPKVGVPCVVDPGDPSKIWIDWDAAYDEHVPAWEREARVRREAARRNGALDHALERLSNPFAGKIRPDELEIVDEHVARESARSEELREQYMRLNREEMAAKGITPPPAGEGDELKRRMDELTRIHQTGREAKATVLSCQATSRKLANIPVFLLTFEIEGRQVVFEHVYGPMHLRHYKVGRTVDVWLDPTNPDAICPGR